MMRQFLYPDSCNQGNIALRLNVQLMSLDVLNYVLRVLI